MKVEAEIIDTHITMRRNPLTEDAVIPGEVIAITTSIPITIVQIVHVGAHISDEIALAVEVIHLHMNINLNENIRMNPDLTIAKAKSLFPKSD